MSATPQEKLHGWFSQKQSKKLTLLTWRKNIVQIGLWYQQKDTNKRVLVTMVTSKSSHGTSFDDIKYMGELGDFKGKAIEII